MSEKKWYLKRKCYTAWRVALQCIEKAAVFIDSKAGECLHWNGGLEQLYHFEPAVICDLNSCENIPKLKIKKVVIICASLTSSTMLDISDKILRNSFTSCTLITSLVDTSTQKLEDKIKGWLSENISKSEVPEVEIEHFSYFIAPVVDNLFFLPTFNQLPIILSDKVPYDKTLLKKNMQLIATSLHHILVELSCSDVIYSMGTVSNEIADFLQAHPATAERRKAASNPISVVLVDRALDLAGPSSFDTVCLLDQILNTLPHLPHHSSDVAIDMSALCHANVENVFDEALAPGCLAHSEKFGENLFESLIHKKQRSVINELNTLVVGEELDSIKAAARVFKPQTLEKTVSQLKGNYSVIMEKSNILQVCLAVIQSLTGSRADMLDRALKYEKLLLRNLLVKQDHDGVLDHVSMLISRRREYEVSVDILLTMIILVYSVLGSTAKFSLEKENKMIDNLSTALEEERGNPGIAYSVLFPMQADIYIIEATVRRFMRVLKVIANARNSFSRYSSLLSNDSNDSQAIKPLLVQLLKDIVSRTAALPFLSTPSDGRLKSLFFGSSTSSSKTRHPGDNMDLFLFVSGGITGREAHELQETWSRAGRSGRLLIGSTSLISSTDVLTSLLQQVSEE